MEQITIQAKDGLLIQATIFHVENAKGIVQIIHGAKEHQARYFHFAKYLQTKGFAVITSDNRGHGSSVNDEFPLGFMDGMKEIIDDQLLVTKKAEDMYPNKPLSLLGHSLGSVFARCYIQEHDANIEKRSEERRVGKECREWIWWKRVKTERYRVTGGWQRL